MNDLHFPNIQNLSEEDQDLFQQLKALYIGEIHKPSPDPVVIRSLIMTAKRVIGDPPDSMSSPSSSSSSDEDTITFRQLLQSEIREKMNEEQMVEETTTHPTLQLTHAIISVGLRYGLISYTDAYKAEDTVKEFLSQYPSYRPLTPREKRTQPAPPWSADEKKMWSVVQPIFDRCQGMPI